MDGHGVGRVRLPPLSDGPGEDSDIPSEFNELSRQGPGEMANANAGGAALTPRALQSGDIREVVAHLEALQASSPSPQQSNPELDASLRWILAGRPELRPRMAVMTKSSLLRKKILTVVPDGSRAVGSCGMGTTHPWRRDLIPDEFTDHNWPQAMTHPTSKQHFLPGGSKQDHERLLRTSADELRKNAVLSSSAKYSVPRTKRFEAFRSEAQEAQLPPGPGHYLQSVPRGTGHLGHDGEGVVLGANHPEPYRRCLGRQINPILVDGTTLTSSPCYSFSKTRRILSDPAMGHSCHALKSDFGTLSPGLIYEHTSSLSPNTRKSHSKAKRSRSTPVIRCIPMPPENQEIAERA